jgi:hypothetical protein
MFAGARIQWDASSLRSRIIDLIRASVADGEAARVCDTLHLSLGVVRVN